MTSLQRLFRMAERVAELRFNSSRKEQKYLVVLGNYYFSYFLNVQSIVSFILYFKTLCSLIYACCVYIMIVGHLANSENVLCNLITKNDIAKHVNLVFSWK